MKLGLSAQLDQLWPQAWPYIASSFLQIVASFHVGLLAVVTAVAAAGAAAAVAETAVVAETAASAVGTELFSVADSDSGTQVVPEVFVALAPSMRS